MDFLTAVNGKLGRLAGLLVSHCGVAQRPGDADLKLRELRQIAAEAQTLAWIVSSDQVPEDLCVVLIEALGKLNEAVEVLDALDAEFRRSVRTVLKVTDWLSRADEAARTFVSARQAGTNPRVAAAWAVLGQAVSLVPVLGKFYSEMVNQTPGLVAGIRRLSDGRFRRADRASSGR